MKHITLVSCSILMLSCSHILTSPEIRSNKQYFQNQINIISSFEEKKPPGVLKEEYQQALFYLNSVTGNDSKEGYGSGIGYSELKDYNEDIRTWKYWYRKHKRKLTNKYIDSIFNNPDLENNIILDSQSTQRFIDTTPVCDKIKFILNNIPFFIAENKYYLMLLADLSKISKSPIDLPYADGGIPISQKYKENYLRYQISRIRKELNCTLRQ